MNSSIDFSGCVKETTVFSKDTINDNGEITKTPVTRVVIELEGYEPRLGSYVFKDAVDVTING